MVKNNNISSHLITFFFTTYDPSVDETDAIVCLEHDISLLRHITDLINLIENKVNKIN